MVTKPGSESEALLCQLGQLPHPRRPPFPSAHWRENPRPRKPSRCWDCMGKGWADPGGVTMHLGSAARRSCSHDSAPQPWKCGGAPAPPGRAGPQTGTPPGGGAAGAAAAQPAHGFLGAEADLPQQV